MDPKDFPEDGSCFEHTRELYDFICKIRPNIKPGGYQSIKIKPGMAWSKYGIWFVNENSGKPKYTIKELEEYYKPSVLSYKGDIAGFPFEVVDKMLHYQKQQGNSRNITVFEECRFKNDLDEGFSWNKTSEGYNFWQEVIGNKYFDKFFEMYPKEERAEPGFPTLAECRARFPQGTTFNNSNILSPGINDYTIDDTPSYMYENTGKTFHVKWSNKAFTIWKDGKWADIVKPELTKSELLDTAEKMFPEGTIFNNGNIHGSEQPNHTVGKDAKYCAGTATGDIYVDAFLGSFTLYSKSKNMWATIVGTNKVSFVEYPITPEDSYPPQYHAGIDPIKDCVGDVVIHSATAGPITLHFGTGHPSKLEDDPVIMHRPIKSIKPLINFNK